LTGALVDAEVAGDLLVQAPAQDMAEHLALSRTDALETQPQGLPLEPLFARLLVASQGLSHGVEKNLQLHRLLQEVFRPARIARTTEAVSAWPVRKRMGRAFGIRPRAD
jgi:hypothetical protein